MKPLLLLFLRDLRAAFSRRGGAWQAVLFFALVLLLFPFALGPEEAALRPFAPGIAWVAALLAGFLSLHSLYQPDCDDGSLEQWLILPVIAEGVVLAKCLAHWVAILAPLMLAVPFLAPLMHLAPHETVPLLVALIPGTLALSCLGSLGAALTLGHRRGMILLGIIVLPLCIPVLIFGVGASLPPGHALAAAHGSATAALWLLCCVLAPLSIKASAALLRMSYL